jgi:hypothetical protein
MTAPVGANVYAEGHREGVATGLRLALEILTRETARQNHRGQEAAANPMKGEAAQHHYAAYVLEDAAKQVAALFRQAAA